MKITAKTEEAFRSQFQLFLNRPECLDFKGIVYWWRSSKPVPRVVGKSEILYVGQSSRSMYGRYGGKRDFDIEAAYFNRFYRHVIDQYGPIILEVEKVDNPKRIEWEKLTQYYENHLEYPPLNRSIPSEPK